MKMRGHFGRRQGAMTCRGDRRSPPVAVTTRGRATQPTTKHPPHLVIRINRTGHYRVGSTDSSRWMRMARTSASAHTCCSQLRVQCRRSCGLPPRGWRRATPGVPQRRRAPVVDVHVGGDEKHPRRAADGPLFVLVRPAMARFRLWQSSRGRDDAAVHHLAAAAGVVRLRGPGADGIGAVPAALDLEPLIIGRPQP